MNDSMYELIVPRKTPSYAMPAKILSIAACVLLFFILLPLIGVLALAPSAVIIALLVYFVFPKFSTEYEYVLLNYDLQIDGIYNKEKRKKLFETDIRQIEWLAPENTSVYKNASPGKILDFTSREAGASTVYGMLVSREGKSTLLRIEPDETLLSHMKQWTGSKFIHY